ncbi:MAG: hypothetical protein H7066_05160, partial [Cytophagaceae bacterium]|nr:hypothetical protein [Gemmatimonadaceae bacterium]
MSDFYSPRRTIIADVAGLVGMALAGTMSTALVWDTLATGFRTGRLERAFLIFLVVVLGAAALGGMFGLMAGRAIGRSWERRHRSHRPASSLEEHERPGETIARRPPDETSVASAPGVMLRPFDAEVAEFMALVDRAGGDGALRTPDVLRRSQNIGAWDGPRLVGAVRVVSDGRVGL